MGGGQLSDREDGVEVEVVRIPAPPCYSSFLSKAGSVVSPASRFGTRRVFREVSMLAFSSFSGQSVIIMLAPIVTHGSFFVVSLSVGGFRGFLWLATVFSPRSCLLRVSIRVMFVVVSRGYISSGLVCRGSWFGSRVSRLGSQWVMAQKVPVMATRLRSRLVRGDDQSWV